MRSSRCSDWAEWARFYKAYDRDIERVVALKVIRPDLAGNSSIIQRFKQELILARQVTHRNVIRIYDLGEADRVKFITMEFIDGEPLTNLLQRRGKLPPREAVQIIEQVCLALEAAHAEGVVHRDLKPANIMQDSHGRIVVMDFGLAHSMEMPISEMPALRPMDAFEHDSKATAYRSLPGTLIGTPLYMSPEQALREEADGRSDLYTVGLILYELLTGEVPFKGEDATETLLNRLQEKAKPLAEIDPQIPRPISSLVTKCLERSRDARYQTVQELLRDLRAWLHPVRKSWRWAAATIAVTVLASTQLIVQKFVHKPTTQHTPVSVLVADFKNDTGEPVFNGTLEPAFGVALEGASFVTDFSRAQAHKIAAQLQPGAATLDDKLSRLIATRENINVVVSGAIARNQDRYDIHVKAIDPMNGKVLISDHRVSEKKDVLLAVGELAARVRKTLGDTTPQSKQLAAAETFTSKSLEAAHAYATAQDLQLAGKWQEAIQQYQAAVQLDPDLGRAYIGLGNAYHNTGQAQEAMKYYKVALSKVDGMSEREKYRTRGAYYLLIRDTDKAIEQQTQLVRAYPADVAGLSNLALAYFYRRDMPKALELGREGLKVYPHNVIHMNNVGLYAMYASDFENAIREQQEVLALNDKFVLAYVGTALSQLALGDMEAARQTYTKLEGLTEQGASASAAGLADLALYLGHPKDAISILVKGAARDASSKNTDGQARKLSLLGLAYLQVGRKADGLSVAAEAARLSQDTGVQYFVARVYREAGLQKKSLLIAGELERSLESDPQAYGKLIEAEAQISNGDARAALKLIQESRALADTWMGRFDEARALLQADAFAEAESALDVCMKRRGEATALFLDESPTYFLFPPVYYYLGLAQQGLNSPAATDSLKSYIGIKSDGQDALLKDARRRTHQK
jgi:tetratricopeptide (TPR) repeat protein